MSVRDLKTKSKTDWARVDQMKDEDIDTSDSPPLDDAFFERARKFLPRIRVDRIDLTKARRFADHILHQRWKKQSPTADAFNIALIVSYCKPFSMRKDLEGKRELWLDRQVDLAEILSPEEAQLHNRVKELRNSYVAHSDADSVLFRGLDYSRTIFLHKEALNLKKSDVELLRRMIGKWIKYLDNRIELTKPPKVLIAPASDS